MALFFDRGWFDKRLAELGLDSVTVAKTLGLNEHELAEMWKDQRELTARDVAMLAALLAVPAEEIARRAGVSTPVPGSAISIGDLRAHLARIEQKLDELATLIRGKK